MPWAKGGNTTILRKATLIAALGGSCATCGESRLAALVLHHVDPDTRSFPNTGNKGVIWRRSLRNKDTWREARHCRVLCCNCHALEHAKHQGDMDAVQYLTKHAPFVAAGLDYDIASIV